MTRESNRRESNSINQSNTFQHLIFNYILCMYTYLLSTKTEQSHYTNSYLPVTCRVGSCSSLTNLPFDLTEFLGTSLGISLSAMKLEWWSDILLSKNKIITMYFYVQYCVRRYVPVYNCLISITVIQTSVF